MSLTTQEALNRLTDIGVGYIASQALAAACTLGVFEDLAKGPATADDLANRLEIHPLACRRLLVFLRRLELVESAGGSFRNSPLGAFLTSSSPHNLAPLAGGVNPFYRMFEFLPDALREYSPRWKQALGATSDEIFGELYSDPARLRGFTALMNVHSIPFGEEVARRIGFAPYHCILDVAGGPGGISVSIGRAHPHLRGIVMDMPPICQVAQEHIDANGLTGRFTTATADLFAGPYPAGADVITLGWILHDWPDDKGRAILRNCFNALPSGGLLVVCEKVLNDDHSGSHWAHALDLVMLIACESGARERTLPEYLALLEEAGFRDVTLQRLDAPRDILSARKP